MARTESRIKDPFNDMTSTYSSDISFTDNGNAGHRVRFKLRLV